MNLYYEYNQPDMYIYKYIFMDYEAFIRHVESYQHLIVVFSSFSEKKFLSQFCFFNVLYKKFNALQLIKSSFNASIK